MDGGSTMLIVILILLICGSAFFSASETALTSLSRIRLRNMVDEKVKNADKIQRLLDNPSKLLSTILVGNNLVNNGASALTTALAIQIFHGDAGSAGLRRIFTCLHPACGLYRFQAGFPAYGSRTGP